MLNVMVKGVLKANIPYWAVSAYPAGHLHPMTVVGEEHRRRKVPAFASCHPGALHGDLPDQPHVTVTPKPGSRYTASVGSQASLRLSIWQPADAVLTPAVPTGHLGLLESRQTPGVPHQQRQMPRVTVAWCRCLAGDSGPGARPQRGVRRLTGNTT
jgi:hypothetical protein